MRERERERKRKGEAPFCKIYRVLDHYKQKPHKRQNKVKQKMMYRPGRLDRQQAKSKRIKNDADEEHGVK